MNPITDVPAGHEPLLDARQVAQRLNVPLSWVYDNAGALPVLRVGRALRFRPSELDTWIDQQRERSATR